MFCIGSSSYFKFYFQVFSWTWWVLQERSREGPWTRIRKIWEICSRSGCRIRRLPCGSYASLLSTGHVSKNICLRGCNNAWAFVLSPMECRVFKSVWRFLTIDNLVFQGQTCYCQIQRRSLFFTLPGLSFSDGSAFEQYVFVLEPYFMPSVIECPNSRVYLVLRCCAIIELLLGGGLLLHTCMRSHGKQSDLSLVIYAE